MFSLPGRRRPTPDNPEIVPGFAPTPADVAAAEVRRIFLELEQLRAVQPRTDTTRAAMDFWLDRRLGLGGVGIRPSVPVNPGRAS